MDDQSEMEEGMYPSNTQDEIQDDYRETGAALEEEFDLDSILAELEAEEELNEAQEEDLDEAKKKEKEKKEDEDESEKDEDESEEEIDIKDMSIDDLKDLIKDIVSQELDSEEGGMPSDDEMEMGTEMGPEGDDEMMMDDEEEINLEEILAELDELENSSEELDEAKKKEKKEDKKDELKEAIQVIKTLRKELNEVNLLNAKLLYINKIFKAKNLSESQKLKVISSFDKATTTREAKLLYESLNSSLVVNTKNNNRTSIKESLGFASKAAGKAPNRTIVESNDVITRMQKLANIIK